MSARYCKRKGCSEQLKGPCPVAGDCFLFEWDIEREKGKKPKESITPTEETEQIELCEWCEAKGIPMIHIPNERKCSAAVAHSLARQGLRKGFPDNFIAVANKTRHGLFIELKRAKKNLSKKSPEQREWIERLNEQGYKAVFCYGAEEAKRVILEYLGE